VMIGFKCALYCTLREIFWAARARFNRNLTVQLETAMGARWRYGAMSWSPGLSGLANDTCVDSQFQLHTQWHPFDLANHYGEPPVHTLLKSYTFVGCTPPWAGVKEPYTVGCTLFHAVLRAP
jgi:hypothetical protein